MKPVLKGKGKHIEDAVIAFRRELHRYPELSGEEYETSKKIQAKLQEIGIPYTAGYAGTGILGVIEGNGPGPTVALRADIDALPIQEETGLPYASQVQGKMHACGHDAHTAMLWGAGSLLQACKDRWPGKVLMVFQPAEEFPPIGGAQPMIHDGVFAEHQPDCIFAQHVWPGLPVGQIGVRPGPMMGASDRFEVVIEGRGGHASMPHQTVDAIVVANAIITNLQTIVSRNVNPLDAAVLTVGRIEGGVSHNVVADKVVLEGTVRTFKPEVKQKVKTQFFSVVEGMAQAMGARALIRYYDGYPATENHPRWAEQVRQTARELLGPESTPDVEPCLGGEDFSGFLLHYPGAYYWLGTGLDDQSKQFPLHDPRFQIDERALVIGTELLAQVAVDAIFHLAEKGGQTVE
ncbi:amidohydrolase [Caldalkalibacillus thermarum TA2.A1]|uniref:Amidohydrolase n=1 Tax=Caldalkalibacillus thermarum (strain TA2.A1) TaxID=986075 RepID=F5LA35_CALTT|nr:M20 family metallopeptidase [Caldalkalibacillus thermarum]EGL81755.1 amidohydrolase [Caldalkalibacillus thermarum TA2.A1]QZT34131.1 amidohydrolase [Caldalkalibacillus thermarum TA2.A1]